MCICKILVRRVDNDGKTVWSSKIGDGHKNANQNSYSVGFSVAEVMFLTLSPKQHKSLALKIPLSYKRNVAGF